MLPIIKEFQCITQIRIFSIVVLFPLLQGKPDQLMAFIVNPGILSFGVDFVEPAVKIRLHRARKQLRTALNLGCDFSYYYYYLVIYLLWNFTPIVNDC